MSEIIENENAGSEERTHQASLRDLYYVLFRHKWKMILFFLTVIITVTLGTFLTAAIYRSEAKLMVRLGRENVSLDPTMTTGQIINVSQSRLDEINSEMEIIKSRELAEKVVDFIGSEKLLNRPDEELLTDGMTRETLGNTQRKVRSIVRGPRDLLERLDLVDPVDDRDKAVLSVIKNLKVDTLKGSSIISISYEAQSRELARDVIAKLINLYLEKHIAVYQTHGSYEFFSEQSDNLREKLLQAESELRDTKNRIGVASPDEQRLIVMNRIGDLKQMKESTEVELAVSKDKIQAMQKMLAVSPNTVVAGEGIGFSDHGADLMRARLYELQIEEQDLVSKFNEESRQVTKIRQEVAEAQALLDKQRLNSVQSELFSEEITLSSLQAKVEKIEKQLAEAQAELKVVNEADFRITQLAREIDILKTSYHKYSDSLEQVRIDQAMEAVNISNISVVQPATFPIKPIRPRKSLNLALGLILGILGSIGLAFFCQYMDHSIKTPENVKENLQLPTLASIPYIRLGRKVSEIPTKIRQSYSTLGEQLLLNSNGSIEKTRTLAIIGCHRGEGVSTVAMNISAWLAQHDNGNVLLVDANTSHPLVHQFFKKKLSPGLVDILKKGQPNGDTIVESSVQKLHILSAGSKDINLSEVVEPGEFRTLLQSMKKSYRYVIIDLPAVSQTSIVPLMSGLCDDAVIVVAAERSRLEVVQRLKEQLVKSQANILGVVLNKRRFYIPQWLYRTL